MIGEMLKTTLAALRSAFCSRAALLAENVALRQQIVVLQRSVAKPRIRTRDRVVLALAARIFGEVVKAVRRAAQTRSRAHGCGSEGFSHAQKPRSKRLVMPGGTHETIG